MAVAVAVAVKEGAAVSAESAVVKEGAAMSAVTAAVTAATAVAATVNNAPTRWADRQLMKIRQRAHTTPAMPMRDQTCSPCL